MKVPLRNSLLATGVISTLAFASMVGISAVNAAESAGANGPTALIEKIATRFNLNKDEVKAVFDEEHTAREAEKQKSQEQRLSQLVTDGKITADQKNKILAKTSELQAKHEAEKDALKDKTEAERRAIMEANRAELEKWAADNGISLEYVRPLGGRGHRGMGAPR